MKGIPLYHYLVGGLVEKSSALNKSELNMATGMNEHYNGDAAKWTNRIHPRGLRFCKGALALGEM